MKRVLAAWLFCAGISMFFTGCSSLIVDMDQNYNEIDRSAASAVSTSEGGARPDYSEEEAGQELPDYLELNLEGKFRDLEGKQAFQIAAGHSAKSGELEEFQIGTLKTDGTFLYAYVTCPEGGSGSGRIIHCAASYNYRTEQFRIIHQNVFTRDNEDEESFYIQVDESGGLFVYDNGVGYLYSAEGRLTFQTDIETFVRTYFDKAYSVTTVHAVTDGNYKIYLELAIEKEKVDIPENPEGDEAEVSEEEADREAEEADREVEQKIQDLVLVYDFRELPGTMNQDNVNFDEQNRRWQEMTAGREFETDPDAAGDMDQVRRELVDVWGCAYLPGLGNSKVYGWKSGPAFQYEEDGYVCTFHADSSSYQEYTGMTRNTDLRNLFTPYNGRYYEIFGRTGDFTYYDDTRISRSYTFVWYTTETDSEGNEQQVRHSEQRTQEISRCGRRKAALSGAFLEGYWVLDDQNIADIRCCMDGHILCIAGEKLCWLSVDGRLIDTGFAQGEEGIAGAFRDGDQRYLVFSDKEKLRIAEQIWQSDGTVRLNNTWQMPYDRLADDYAPGDSDYDQAFEELNGDRLNEDVIYGGGDFYTAEMVLPANITVDRTLALFLRQKGVDTLLPRVGSGCRGFLLTSEAKGLVYYDITSHKGVRVSSGCWYRTWKQGSRFFSVGFQNSDASYDSLDVASARIYEYDLNELYRSSMEAEAENIRRREQEAQEEAASRSLEDSKEETEETVKEMLTEWEERRSREETTAVNLQPYVSEGETFDANRYNEQEATRKAQEESSDEARINEILK